MPSLIDMGFTNAVQAEALAAEVIASEVFIDALELKADDEDVAEKITNGGGVLSAKVVTQAVYDALSPPVADTIYFIVG